MPIDLMEFSRRKRAKALQEAAHRQLGVFRQLLPFDAQVKKVAQSVVSELLFFAASDRAAFELIERMAAHGTKFFPHSLKVSMLSALLARGLKAGDPAFIEICAVGGLFHDVSLLGMPVEMVDARDLTSIDYVKTLAMVESQTRLSLKLLESVKLGGESLRYLMSQLHEEPSGLGYPAGLSGEVIFKPALVVAVADMYCALTEKTAARPALSPQEAVLRMRSEVGRYSSDVIDVLASSIGESETKRSAA